MKINLRLYFVLISLILLSKTSLSQYVTMSDLLNKVFLVRVGNFSGSGFFISIENKVFFVTAKHVIINEKINQAKEIERTKIDSNIYIISYSQDVVKNKPDTLVIDFDKSSAANFLRYTLQKDIAMIYIGKIRPINDSTSIYEYQPFVQRLTKGTRINSFFLDDITTFENINIGEDIVMAGYPKSLGDASNNQYDFDRPLLRKGIIAGKAISILNIIVDCPSYGGNSGGPVFVEETFVKENKVIKNYKLIGLVKGFIPYNEVWYNQNYRYSNVEINNSGFSEIVPIDFVISLYKDLKKIIK